MVHYLVGVDGGGTGTRAVLADLHGQPLARGEAGPAALALGIAAAWRAIASAIEIAAAAAGRVVAPADCALGLGLAGANHPGWRAAFLSANPGYARVALDTDGGVALRAAHRGAPGVLVAAGTGSVAEALMLGGQRCSAGGWGFPVGDEGSGAWLGMGAMRHAQCALDGRALAGALANAVWRECGADRDRLLAWSTAAGQGEYASLAPLVFACAAQDSTASALLDGAARALEELADALDPDGVLPVVLTGSVGRRLRERCTPRLHARLAAGDGDDAALGALALVRATPGAPA